LSTNPYKNPFIVRGTSFFVRLYLVMPKSTIFGKALYRAILFLALLVLIVASISSRVVLANPYMYHLTTEPKAETNPPKICITSPINTSYNKDQLSFSYNVSKPEGGSALGSFILHVEYTADWLNATVCDYDQNKIPQFPEYQEFNHFFVGIPEGNHSIIVNATGCGGYADMNTLTWYSFNIVGYAVVNFTVDKSPPKISIPSIDNKSFGSNSIDFEVVTNEQVCEVKYSLDSQANVTIPDDTITIANLTNGLHKLTVYAQDTAGNFGASDATIFSINVAKEAELANPQTIIIAAVSGIGAVFILSAGLIINKKRKNKSVN
jgi:hypothetical protein